MNRVAPVALVVLIAAASALDALVPVDPRTPPSVDHGVTPGVLSCPLAAEGSARAFLHLANLGDEASDVRVSLIPSRGRPVELMRTVRPAKASRLRLHGRVDGRASVVIEHAGGELTASHSLWYAGRRSRGLRRVPPPRGAAAAACVVAGPAELSLAHLRTNGARSRVVLLNPGTADADVSLRLIVGQRTVRPERLERRVVPARRSIAVDIEDFAFNEPEVTAVVSANAGRVVAEASVVAGSGVTLVGAVPPSDGIIAMSGSTGSGAGAGIAATGSDDAGVEASLIGPADQGHIGRVPTDLRPGSGTRIRTPLRAGGGPAAYQIDATVGGPLAAGTSWRVSRASGAERAATGHTTTALRWIAAAGSIEDAARLRAVLVNPGDGPAAIRIRRLGGDGAEDVTLDAGRVTGIPLGRGATDLGVAVEADQPIAVLIEGSAQGRRGGRRTVYGFGFAASPVVPPPGVGVVVDQRAGVPARRLQTDQ